jgi:hypothetical protein
MADGPVYRTLQETPEFSAQYDALIEKYSVNVIGPVLDALFWGITSNPKGYDGVAWRIRVAKNDILGLTIPRFRIFFSIEREGNEDEYVLLLWIEDMPVTEEIIG